MNEQCLSFAPLTENHALHEQTMDIRGETAPQTLTA